MKRCSWPKSELDIAYHDAEWGKPVHEDRLLFEMLMIKGSTICYALMQATGMVNDHLADCFRNDTATNR